MTTLWELDRDLSEIERLLDESEEGEVGADLLAYLERTEGAVADKVDGYVALITSPEARSKAREEEADRLRALAETDDARARRLRMALHAFVSTHGPVETVRARVSAALDSGQDLPFARFAPRGKHLVVK